MRHLVIEALSSIDAFHGQVIIIVMGLRQIGLGSIPFSGSDLFNLFSVGVGLFNFLISASVG